MNMFNAPNPLCYERTAVTISITITITKTRIATIAITKITRTITITGTKHGVDTYIDGDIWLYGLPWVLIAMYYSVLLCITMPQDSPHIVACRI